MGLCWTEIDERHLRRFARLVRGVLRVLPEPLRFAPLAYAALARERERTSTATGSTSTPAEAQVFTSRSLTARHRQQ